MFTEMRTAALIQKALLGPKTLPAPAVLRMATSGGAKALGLDREIGSIETGKRADLILLDLEKAHTSPHPDPVSAIVYSATASDVDTVIIDGRAVMRGGDLLTLDEQEVLRSAREHAELLNSFF
jgi:cytosine/adenosine deaminase-related metal-dependent hydrolase